MREPPANPLSLAAKVRLLLRVWGCYARVRFGMGRVPFPEFVAALGRPTRLARRRYPPRTLSRAVARSLTFGRIGPTCLVNALVLYRLLREQGDPAEVVIGLPPHAADHRAHAWVELDGQDVGPPPGRSGHTAMVRFA